MEDTRSYYAQPRATKDLDVFVENSAENAALIFAALAKFGAPLAGMSAKDFQVGNSPRRIDILQTIEAIEFNRAWESSEEGMTGDGIAVRYISVGDLITNKLAVGRLRDLADVEDLRASRAAISKPIKSDTSS